MQFSSQDKNGAPPTERNIMDQAVGKDRKGNVLSQSAESQILLASHQSKSYHKATLIANLILLAVVITMPILISNQIIYPAFPGFIMVVAYFGYLVTCFKTNTLLKYLKILQSSFDIVQDYEKNKQAACYFEFHAECYHFEDVHDSLHDSHGKSSRRKVVTYQNSERMPTITCEDKTGRLGVFDQGKKLFIIRNVLHCQFGDGQSQANLSRAYENFQQRHKIDRLQDFTKTFKANGLVQRSCYQTKKTCNYYIILIISIILGLAWPVSFAIEKMSSRYTIDFKKKATF